MPPLQTRLSLLELLDTLDRTHRIYKTTIVHAPAADKYGWGSLSDLAALTATQAQTVLDRMAQAGEWDATLPEPTPDLSKNLAGRIRERREANARDAVIEDWRKTQARPASRPSARLH